MGYRIFSAAIFLVVLLQPILVQSGLQQTHSCRRPSYSANEGENAKSGASEYFPTMPATINDFYINNTQTDNTTEFAFNVSDSVDLQNATFSSDGGAGTWANQSVNLSGTNAWANFTVNSFSSSTLLNFTFWVWNTNTSLSPATIGYRTLAIYSTSMPYTSLGKAITAVEGANSWSSTNSASGFTGVQPYEGLILNQNTTEQYESVVDGYANGVQISGTNAYVQGSYVDSSSGSNNWNNPSYAYDNNTATAATASCSSQTYYLVLNLGKTIGSNTIQYLVHRSNTSATPSMLVDIYQKLDTFGTSWSWLNVFNAQPTWESTVDFTFTRALFSAMRFCFSPGGAYTVCLNETQSFDAYRWDYLNALACCTYSEKMNLTWANKQNDLIYALGNITMANHLPATDSSAYSNGYMEYPYDFGLFNTFALYGFYYANTSWANQQAKWNITAAYAQFDSAVNYSVSKVWSGLPLWIFGDNTGLTYLDRYYDEDAETIQAYLIFYSLLNVSDALNKAVYWWNYLVNTHWRKNYGGYFRYDQWWPTDPAFECEAGFFLKVTSILKYYYPNLENYSYVLSDIGNRFLSKKWNSYQWLGNPSTTYVVTHLYSGNNQTRLVNTLGAWQALLGAYKLFNTTYQNNMADMLAGNTTESIQPAWSLLMSSTAALWDSTSKLFRGVSGGDTSSEATAIAEITLFHMGILPQTSTIAFPLEELKYEYIFDIDPVLLAFDFPQDIRQITVPVVQAGTITFQYGESPTSYTFSQSGIYVINFTDSWNMISTVTLTSALPSNLIYCYLPPPGHDVSVTDVTSSKTVVGQGYNLSISVTAADLGGYPETFNVMAYTNATCIAVENVSLFSGSSTNIFFTWNTSGFAYGNYTISTYACPVPGETNTSNNNVTGGVVYVGIPGDIDADGTVDICDAIKLCSAFGGSPSSLNWNPNMDINNDGIVDVADAIILSNHFLGTIP